MRTGFLSRWLLRGGLGCVFLAAFAASAPAQMVEAFAGRPFGVGRMTVRVLPGAGEPHLPLLDDRYLLVERTGRALYPAMEQAPVRRFLRNLLEIEGPAPVTVYFLFQGDGPLDLTFYTPEPQTVTVRPRINDRQWSRLLEGWWWQYTGEVRRVGRDGEYPLVVENYLVPTLARRLRLDIPRALWLSDPGSEVQNAVREMYGSESAKSRQMQTLLLGPSPASGPADQPLPPEEVAVPLEYPAIREEPKIEAMAKHVPEECFYVRFGSFNNYLWYRDFLSQWGGDLRNMVSNRGLDYRSNQRIEDQLNLRESALSRIAGPSVIADVAFVGEDFFMREGGAYGLLFQARSNDLLLNNLVEQRKALLDKVPDAKLETIKLAGREVTLLSTPDMRIRSFLASDGDFHLVTTSQSLARRFLEASGGRGSLGESAGFQYARSLVPLERNDAVFAYLSAAFFHKFVTPQYRIEMQRRGQSLAEMESLRLARLAARAEGLPIKTKSGEPSIDDLIAADMLPRGFGQRVDGSRIVEKNGKLSDSTRGKPGTLIPIPDMPIEGITREELANYQRFAETYAAQWQRMDPIVAGISHRPLDKKGLERIMIDAYVSPYVPEHYGQVLGFVGRPTSDALAPIEGDVLSLQVVSSGRGLFGLGPGKETLLFGGLRDARVPPEVRGGSVTPAQGRWDSIRGYVGAWPNPGILGLLLGTPSPEQTDPAGNSSINILGITGWQRRVEDFLLFSFNREVVDDVSPQLAIVETERQAQLRLHADHLGASQLAGLLNSLGYSRARQTATSGARVMNTLVEQLRVPPDRALPLAEEFLAAKLVSSLGGEFKLVEFPGGLEAWSSGALPAENKFLLQSVPEDYQFPVLKWFRGADVEALATDSSLSAHVVIDMQLEPIAEGFQFPTLPTFSLPSFGKSSEKKTEKKAAEKATDAPEELPAPKK